MNDELEFGIKKYIIPKGEYARLPIPKITALRAKEKRNSFIDDEV